MISPDIFGTTEPIIVFKGITLNMIEKYTPVIKSQSDCYTGSELSKKLNKDSNSVINNLQTKKQNVNYNSESEPEYEDGDDIDNEEIFTFLQQKVISIYDIKKFMDYRNELSNIKCWYCTLSDKPCIYFMTIKIEYDGSSIHPEGYFCSRYCRENYLVKQSKYCLDYPQLMERIKQNNVYIDKYLNEQPLKFKDIPDPRNYLISFGINDYNFDEYQFREFYINDN